MKILVLPGLDGTDVMLTDFITELRDRHDVEVVRYPKKNELSYMELAGFVLKRVPQSDPYAIIAESFSGPVAALVASQTSENLRAIVFAASFLRNPTTLPKASVILADILPANSRILLRLARPFTFGRWATRQLDSLLLTAVRTIPKNVLASRIKEVMRVNELSKLGGIKVPMLYLRPTNDRLVSRASSIAMRKENPELDITDVIGPHFILQTNPRECANKVHDFLEAISDNASS